MFSSLQYELFLKILPRYLKPGDKVLELGSGPGDNLVIINKLLDCKVYGIESNFLRYQQNKLAFSQNSIPLSNLTFDDFRKLNLKTKTDAVISLGLIEHFKKH